MTNLIKFKELAINNFILNNIHILEPKSVFLSIGQEKLEFKKKYKTSFFILIHCPGRMKKFKRNKIKRHHIFFFSQTTKRIHTLCTCERINKKEMSLCHRLLCSFFSMYTIYASVCNRHQVIILKT